MKRHILFVMALALALASFPAPHAHAADQVVTDCSNDTELRADLTAMQAGGGGTLTFNCGTATIVLDPASGPISITGNVTIDGNDTITLSGGNATWLLAVETGGTLTLQDITITKGYNANSDGGAIRAYGTLNIHSSKLLDNQTAAAYSGGAVMAQGPLNITGSEFAFNKAGNGGALYPRFSGAIKSINSSNFHDNETTNTTNRWGGAILVWDGATVIVTSSTFSNNSAWTGGAIYVYQNSTLTLFGSTLNGNPAAWGGGIYNDGTATLTSVTLNGNSATVDGGGIDNAGTATLTNVTLSGNSAGEQGGGIFSNGTATLTNVTLSGNSADSGGGMYGSGTTTLKNTIVANSTGGNCSGTIVNGGFNFSSDRTCGFEADRLNVDVMLGPLAFNGGSTQTHLPQSGSPAIDNGTGNDCPSTDQRGVTRPQGAACDVGSVEVVPQQATATPTTAATATPTRTPTVAPPSATPTHTPTRTPTVVPPSATPTRTATTTRPVLPETATATPTPLPHQLYLPGVLK